MKSALPSNVSLDEVRTISEINVFGVLAMTQTMRSCCVKPQARIMNVSGGADSLILYADPARPGRSLFVPRHAASKTALKAMALATAIKLDRRG